MSRVLVCGSANMDLRITVPRFPNPGETLLAGELSYTPGGKGSNQAVAARRSGAETVFAGAIGDDAFGREVSGFLSAEGVEVLNVDAARGVTGVAIVTVTDGGENSIVVASGVNAQITPGDVSDLGIRAGDVVLLQGEIPDDVNRAVQERARAGGAIVVLNPSPFRRSAVDGLQRTDIIVVNEIEFAQMVGAGLGSMSRTDISDALTGGSLMTDQIVVTLGGAGVLARFGAELHDLAAFDVSVVDTTGAGDCFCGAFAACLARGLSPLECVKFANAAAALAVQQAGAGSAMPALPEVLHLLGTPPRGADPRSV